MSRSASTRLVSMLFRSYRPGPAPTPRLSLHSHPSLRSLSTSLIRHASQTHSTPPPPIVPAASPASTTSVASCESSSDTDGATDPVEEMSTLHSAYLDDVRRAVELPVPTSLPLLDNKLLEEEVFRIGGPEKSLVPFNFNELEWIGDRELNRVAAIVVLALRDDLATLQGCTAPYPGPCAQSSREQRYQLLNSRAYAAKLALALGFPKRLEQALSDNALAGRFESFVGALALDKGSAAVVEFLAPLFALELRTRVPIASGPPAKRKIVQYEPLVFKTLEDAAASLVHQLVKLDLQYCFRRSRTHLYFNPPGMSPVNVPSSLGLLRLVMAAAKAGTIVIRGEPQTAVSPSTKSEPPPLAPSKPSPPVFPAVEPRVYKSLELAHRHFLSDMRSSKHSGCLTFNRSRYFLNVPGQALIISARTTRQQAGDLVDKAIEQGFIKIEPGTPVEPSAPVVVPKLTDTPATVKLVTKKTAPTPSPATQLPFNFATPSEAYAKFRYSLKSANLSQHLFEGQGRTEAQIEKNLPECRMYRLSLPGYPVIERSWVDYDGPNEAWRSASTENV